jgi:hypothetical protein
MEKDGIRLVSYHFEHQPEWVARFDDTADAIELITSGRATERVGDAEEEPS